MRFTGMVALTVALVAGMIGCKGVSETSAPVELVASSAQELHVIDLSDADCPSIGTVELRNLIKRPDAATDTRFLDVRLDAYRVSYQRTDGGTLVPESFTRSLSSFVAAGGASTSIDSFLVFEPDSLAQAPFAALRQANGGTDPETGKRSVDMDVIIDFFGETLSGEDVSARTRFGLTFCNGCGGCF